MRPRPLVSFPFTGVADSQFGFGLLFQLHCLIQIVGVCVQNPLTVPLYQNVMAGCGNSGGYGFDDDARLSHAWHIAAKADGFQIRATKSRNLF
jgi:hypothetical protein